MKKITDAATIIGILEDGETVRALSDDIARTLMALKAHTKGRKKAKAKGKVVLTLDIEVEGASVTITPDITTKVPKPIREGSFYWVTDDGALTTEHPQQTSMFDGPREATRAS